MPNPTLFIVTINLQEAQVSSSIENIITTQDELFKASIEEKRNDNLATKEVMYYKDALWYGVEQIEKPYWARLSTFSGARLRRVTN